MIDRLQFPKFDPISRIEADTRPLQKGSLCEWPTGILRFQFYRKLVSDPVYQLLEPSAVLVASPQLGELLSIA